MALFVMQALIAAVDDLVALESESLEGLLARLQKEEDDHYVQVSRRNPLDDELREIFNGTEGLHKLCYNFEDLSNAPPDFDWYSLFLTGKSVCHTARLPSRIRYLGFLTDSTKTGGPSVFGEETFDVGLEDVSDPEAGNSLPLVWDAEGKWRNQCPFVIAPDNKDFFYTQHGYGWRELVIPSASMREAYHYDPSAMKGIVIMVFQTCWWGQCPENRLQPKDLEDGKWDIKINDVPVTKMTAIGNEAVVAQNADGITFPQGPDGGYKLGFHVNEPGWYQKIYSIIVF